MHTREPLYDAAVLADQYYSQTIARLTKRTRWTINPADEAHPEIQAAYVAKVTADRAWLDYMRGTR